MQKPKKHKKSVIFKNAGGKAAFSTLVFVYIYIIAEIFYKHFAKGELCEWEFMLLFLIFAVYGIVKKLSLSNNIPTNFNGTPLPLSLSKEDKKIRNTYYVINTAVYTAVFSVVLLLALLFSTNSIGINIALELFTESAVPNFFVSLLITLVFALPVYAFTYIINYLWYENRIAELAAEEQELPAPDISEDIKKIKSEQNEEKPAPKRRGRPPKAKAEIHK